MTGVVVEQRRQHPSLLGRQPLSPNNISDFLQRLEEELFRLRSLVENGGGQGLHAPQLLVLDLDQAPETGGVQRGLLQLLRHRGLQLLRPGLESLHVHELLLLQLIHSVCVDVVIIVV